MDFGFFLSETFVWTYCGVIVILWLTWTRNLSSKSRTLRTKLRGLTDELHSIPDEAGFSSAFEDYNSKAKRAFGLPWTEFVETLVLPEPGSDPLIRNPVDVSRYLNDTTIIFPRISFSFYQSVPNLLTGLGILGTFVGLAFGVGAASSGISSGDPSAITASLQELLDGASLAFLTSIFGISSSILFVPVVRFWSRRLHLEVDRWVGSLEDRMRRVTPESVALDQLEQARSATEQLKTFNTELVFSIEKALDEGIAGRLTPQFERLIDAVDGIRTDRSTDAGQMVERALDRFTTAMQERTGDQFEEMASIVANLNETLKDSAAGLARSQKDVGETLSSVMTEVKASMGAGAAAMAQTLERSLAEVTHTVSGASQQLADQLTASSASAATELSEVFGSSSQRIADVCSEAVSNISVALRGLAEASASLDRSTRQSEHVLANMSGFVDRINSLRDTIESAHREIVGCAASVRQAARDTRASSQKTVDATERMGGRFDAAESMFRSLDRHQESVASAWAGYQERFEGIDRSLASVFRQIDEGLSGYCEQVKAFANELDRTTAQTVEYLAGATGELSQSIEDLADHLQSRP
ncbi:MAG: hypothetical protein OXH99_11415 [Bryobacterales bacterium]|nr:hypothetical protein [Bryobacterales bacterium]